METPLLKIFHGFRTVDRGLLGGDRYPGLRLDESVDRCLGFWHSARLADALASAGLMPGSIDPDHAVLYIVTSVE